MKLPAVRLRAEAVTDWLLVILLLAALAGVLAVVVLLWQWAT
jgi:hypothetical protein